MAVKLWQKGWTVLAIAALLLGLAFAAMAISKITPGGYSLRAEAYAPPNTLLLASPPTWTNDNKPNYEFDSDQSAATFKCRWDEAAWFSCQSPWEAGKAQPEGKTVFTIQAVNRGRLDPTPVRDTIYIDTIKPRTSIDGPSSTFDRTPKMSLRSNEENVNFECSLDGGEWESCKAAWIPSGPLAFGEHNLRARSTDRAGNTDGTPAKQVFHVRRDTTPPRTSISGPEKTKDRTPTFKLDANEDNVTFQCSLDGGAWFGCGRNYVASPALSYGNHRLRARATDASGNTDPSPANHTFRIIK